MPYLMWGKRTGKDNPKVLCLQHLETLRAELSDKVRSTVNLD
jgi:hypothetical protein